MADHETPVEILYVKSPLLPAQAEVWAMVICHNCGANPQSEGTIQRTIQMEIYDEFPFEWVCRCGFGRNPLIPHHNDCPCTLGGENVCEIRGWFEPTATLKTEYDSLNQITS